MDAALKTIEQEGQNPGELIVQQFVEGTPASVAFLVGPDTMLSLQPCHQWLSTDGRFRYEGGMCPMGHADYAPRAVRLAGSALRAIPGLFGYVGVDVVLGNLEPRDYVIEVNPRLTTSYVGLRALADFNIAEAMLNIARGENLPPLGWKKQFVDFMPNGTVSFVSDTLV
jgi:predicted ATP-grasp superfamily ATP-dependent carboligase